MDEPDDTAKQVGILLDTPDLARALDNEPFRRFLDQVPIAIVVSEIGAAERIAYANPEFERVSGLTAASLTGADWSALDGEAEAPDATPRRLAEAIPAGQDCVGTFRLARPDGQAAVVDAYSNLIEDEAGVPAYRLAVLVEVGAHDRTALAKELREKDLRLLEIQHRVKNNLQMIAALIRIEARNADGRMDTAPFDRLAGRIEAIQILYGLLSEGDKTDKAGGIDLGVYLSDIASSVLRSHAVEGIRLELKVDAYPVSVNVALPTGLVVNELLTNALKHAFVGRDGGTITLHSLSDGEGCRIAIADDGIGLPDGAAWPRPGKLSAMIVQSLRQNAGASVAVESRPGEGMRVSIAFRRAAAAPGPKG